MVEIYFDLTPDAIYDANNIYSILTDPIESAEEQVISVKITNAVCLVDSQPIDCPFSIIANRIGEEIIYLIADLNGFSQIILPSEVCIVMDSAYFDCDKCEGANCECCSACDQPCDSCICNDCDSCSSDHDPVEDSEIQNIADLPKGDLEELSGGEEYPSDPHAKLPIN